MLYLHKEWLSKFIKIIPKLEVSNSNYNKSSLPFENELLGYELIIFKEIENKECSFYISYMPSLNKFKVSAILLNKITGQLKGKAQRFDINANALDYSIKDINRIPKKYYNIIKQSIECYKSIFPLLFT